MKTKTNVDVYQMVTDRIIAKLEAGVVPWRQEWHGVMEGAFNRITKKPYSLINQMLLSHDGEYASLKQWNKLGGHVKKGEKGEIVVFWKINRYTRTETKVNKDGEEEEVLKVKTVPILKYYYVFHISQIEGVEPLDIQKPTNIDPIGKAEEVITNYVNKDGLKFQNNMPSNRAYYAPMLDLVVVPMLNQFEKPNEYYATAFHELIHSTKHQTRLNRSNDCVSAFGSEDYSKEELVAEIGSCNLMNIVGIETEGTFNNSASYINSWLKVLKNDRRLIVNASAQAQKATNYILQFTEECDEEEDEM